MGFARAPRHTFPQSPLWVTQWRPFGTPAVRESVNALLEGPFTLITKELHMLVPVPGDQKYEATWLSLGLRLQCQNAIGGSDSTTRHGF